MCPFIFKFVVFQHALLDESMTALCLKSFYLCYRPKNSQEELKNEIWEKIGIKNSFLGSSTVDDIVEKNCCSAKSIFVQTRL